MPKTTSARIQDHFAELTDPRRRKATYRRNHHQGQGGRPFPLVDSGTTAIKELF